VAVGNLSAAKKVVALEVGVERTHAGVHRVHVQRQFHLAGLGRAVELHGAALLGPAATVGGGAEVQLLPDHVGVGGVDLVGGGLGDAGGGQHGRGGQQGEGLAHG
jgi:hypothetical protein